MRCLLLLTLVAAAHAATTTTTSERKASGTSEDGRTNFASHSVSSMTTSDEPTLGNRGSFGSSRRGSAQPAAAAAEEEAPRPRPRPSNGAGSGNPPHSNRPIIRPIRPIKLNLNVPQIGSSLGNRGSFSNRRPGGAVGSVQGNLDQIQNHLANVMAGLTGTG